MDSTQLREMLNTMVPFAGTLGFQLEEARPGYLRVGMPHRPELANHLGTLHAGATFTLAETTGGAATLITFGELAQRVIVVNGRIAWLKRIDERATAIAEVPPDLVQRVLGEVERDGKSFFELVVKVTNEKGELAAEAAFEYRVKRPS